MKMLITLPLILSASGLLFSNSSMAITPSQMQMRVSATCNSYASASQIADPNVVYEMCLNGAKESMQGRNSVCERKIRQFREQADTLDGMGRAEYIEIAQAYRMGCNAGKKPSQTNDESKSTEVKSLSPEEIKERQDIQSYGTEIRNALGRINEGASSLTGQKCSINIWFAQNGNVLSTKVESGDKDACSYVLSRIKYIKFSPMNNSQYKAFRNTPVDFSF